jgi:signal peptidase I
MIIAIALIVFSSTTLECLVLGSSMQPKYNSDLKAESDVVYVNTLDKDIQLGDIIVIDAGDKDPIIKRVIGVAGDIIDVVFDESSGYKLEINGKLIEEDYLKIDYDLEQDKKNGLYLTYNNFHGYLVESFPELFIDGKLVVPENQVFALGDNRHDSKDSTYYGTFNNEMILGKVEFERFHNESKFWFYWNYVVQGKFFKTIANCF